MASAGLNATSCQMWTKSCQSVGKTPGVAAVSWSEDHHIVQETMCLQA